MVCHLMDELYDCFIPKKTLELGWFDTQRIEGSEGFQTEMLWGQGETMNLSVKNYSI